jgi:hypothetical protein
VCGSDNCSILGYSKKAVMRALLSFLFILIVSPNLWGQDSLVTIKTGTRIRDVLTEKDILFYPQFINGKVFFKTGVIAGARMNYNLLTDQMLFIDTKSDTLAVSDEKTVNFIAIGADTFYFVDGYARQVTGNSVVKLLEKKVWEVADIRRMGSHNRPANTYAVSYMGKITDGLGRTYDLVQEEDLVLRKRAHYYFGDMYNRFVPASKKNLLSFYESKEPLLANYLKQHKVNFSKKDDLEKVTQFLAQKN